MNAAHPDDLAITYSLGGDHAALFTVEEQTGQIRLRRPVTLEVGPTCGVELTARVTSGTQAAITVVIEVELHRNDLNGSGAIEKNEALAAVSDYFAQ